MEPGSEHPRERGAEILTAQLRSHTLVQSDFAKLLLTLDKYSSWRVGMVVPMICSAVWTTLRSLLWSDLVAELNQTVIEVQRTGSMMAE